MSENANSATVPVTFVAGGAVQAGGGAYVMRPADDALYSLCMRGEFAFVLTSRQMGKSSLMVRTQQRLAAEHVSTVIVDLTAIGLADVTPEHWYSGIVEEIHQQLDLSDDAEERWLETSANSITHRFTQFLADVVLSEIGGRVVLFIDEIDSTLGLPFTDDFFASIRFLYNSRATKPDLNRLSFVLLGVAAPGDLIKDRERTPFNIGTRVELSDFTQESAVAGLSADPKQVADVFHYTGGHPYLTLKVFRSLANHPLTTTLEDRIFALFMSEEGRKDSNIEFVTNSLTESIQSEKVLDLYSKIVAGKKVTDSDNDPVFNALHLSGAVRNVGGRLFIRNLIYKRVFTAKWIKSNQQTNWVKRLALTAGTVASLLIILIVALIPFLLNEGVRAIRLSAERKQAEASARRAEQSREQAERRLQEAQLANTQAEAEITARKLELKSATEALANAKASLAEVSAILKHKTTTPEEKTAVLTKIKEALSLNAAPPAAAQISPMTKSAAPPPLGPLFGRVVVYTQGSLITAKSRHPIALHPVIWLDHHSYARLVSGSAFEVHLPPGDNLVEIGDPDIPGSPSTQGSVFAATRHIVYLKLIPDETGRMYKPVPGNAIEVSKLRPLTNAEKMDPELILNAGEN